MRGPTLAGCLVAAAVTAGGFSARATEGDGLYGRFDGDVDLRVHAGAAFASGGPALAAQLSAVYLSTAGIYLHYTDALGSEAPQVTRSLSAGVHLQPLFLARLAVGAERGPAFMDLLVDSFAFELGAVWSAPRRMGWDDQPGLEAALALALPIVPRASGPYLGLRGALRWRPVDFSQGAPGTFVDRGAVLSLTLGWHQVLRTHLVDRGDVVLP